jgi:hypothetical protein
MNRIMLVGMQIDGNFRLLLKYSAKVEILGLRTFV